MKGSLLCLLFIEFMSEDFPSMEQSPAWKSRVVATRLECTGATTTHRLGDNNNSINTAGINVSMSCSRRYHKAIKSPKIHTNYNKHFSERIKYSSLNLMY